MELATVASFCKDSREEIVRAWRKAAANSERVEPRDQVN